MIAWRVSKLITSTLVVGSFCCVGILSRAVLYQGSPLLTHWSELVPQGPSPELADGVAPARRSTLLQLLLLELPGCAESELLLRQLLVPVLTQRMGEHAPHEAYVCRHGTRHWRGDCVHAKGTLQHTARILVVRQLGPLLRCGRAPSPACTALLIAQSSLRAVLLPMQGLPQRRKPAHLVYLLFFSSTRSIGSSPSSMRNSHHTGTSNRRCHEITRHRLTSFGEL